MKITVPTASGSRRVIDSGKIRHLDDRILADVEEYNSTSVIPFRLSLSIGTVRTEAENRMPVDECIKAADSLMYRNKQKKKAARERHPIKAKDKKGNWINRNLPKS